MLTDAEVTSPKLARALETDFASMTSLVRWLNGVLGLKSRDHR